MIPHLRKAFNEAFTPDKYVAFLQRMIQASGTHIDFRICETPCFFPRAFMDKLAVSGTELIRQLMSNDEYLTISKRIVPPEFNVPQESSHPLFVQVDFGIVRDDAGELQPRLVEIQGFPSLYAYQLFLCQQYVEGYRLNDGLRFLLGDLSVDDYAMLLRRAIVSEHDPRNVVLLEIDPWEQKTLIDFLLTERMYGMRIVNITDVIKEGRKLFYVEDGKKVEIRRIYNRAIVDELVRKQKQIPFSFRDDLDVEWAGHPNWYFRISKFSIPFLRHASVPQTEFLHKIERLPEDLDRYVLKPLFSFAGHGVVVGPTREEIDAIPADQRHQYILQERIDFEPVIDTPHGLTKAEIRVMFIWLDELLPVLTIVRMGRGKMMGVDHNRNMEWVGSSSAFYE